MKKILIVSLTLMAVLQLNACSGCTPQVGAEKSGSIAGTVLKGPVGGATVTAFSVTDAGRRDAELGKATTDEAGAFVVEVGGHTGPVLLCAQGGVYTEEATGGLVQLATNEVCATVDNHELGDKTTGVLLTPFSTWHAALASCFAESGRDTSLSNASAHAALRLNDFLSAGQTGYDFRTTVPFDVTAGTAPSLTPDVWQGILLAGLSESAKGYAVASGLDPGVRVTAATLMTALTQDIDDGACIFDGQSTSGVLSQGTVQLSADSLRGAPQGLATSILRFLEGPQNLSGVPAGDVTDLAQRMSTHESEIFAGGGVVGDLDPPVITFVAPTGAEPISVSGVIPIEVGATDASEIVSFAFTAPTRLIEATKACVAPGDCSLQTDLNSTLEPEGEVPLTVTARDAAGNETTATLRLIINSSLPVVSFSALTNTQPVASTQEIRVGATDPDGIRSIVVTGTSLPLTNISPRSDEFIASWDTTTEAEGSVTLTAVATDERGLSSTISITVEVDNLADGRLTGALDFGAPVTGSTIQVFALSPQGRGDAVSDPATPDDDGKFELLVPSYRGPVAIVAAGGLFVDPATGRELTLDATQELSAALPDFGPGQVATANLNALTTLAEAHAVGADVSDADFAEQITTSQVRFGLHARRNGPERDPLPILETLSGDLSTPLESTSTAAILALIHSGLSRIALEATDDLGLAPGDISPFDVLTALQKDLSNGRLDGRDVDGNDVAYDPGQTKLLDGYTFRLSLVAAIHNFTLNAPLTNSREAFVRNASGITPSQLSVAGALYADVATNDDTRLFSLNDPPIAFDVDAPTVSISLPSHPANAPFGDTLSGPVRIVATASEEATGRSGVSSFRITSPAEFTDPSLDSDTLLERIDITINPRGPTDFSDFSCEGVDLTAVATSRETCLCIEAIDGVQNVRHDAVCFARPRPTVTFVSPTPNQALSDNDFPLNVRVTAGGGYAVSGCEIEALNLSNIVVTENAADFGCVVTARVDSLPDGQTSFVLTGFEAGQLPPDVQLINPDVSRTISVTVDRTAANVTLRQPAPNSVISASTYNVIIDSSERLSELIVEVRDGSVSGNIIKTQTFTNAAGLSFTVPVTDTTQGTRAVVMRARDLAGNAQQPAQSFIRDADAPTQPTASIAPFSREDGGVPFAEPSGTTCLCLAGVTSCVVPRCAIVPRPDLLPAAERQLAAGDMLFSSAALPATAKTIGRWLARIDSTSSAPLVTLSSTDANPDHFEWAIGTTCPTTLTQTSSVASPTIRITKAATGFALDTITSPTVLCLRVKAVDKAGNRSPARDSFFRWQTIQSPIRFSAISSTPIDDSLDAGGRGGTDGDMISFATGQTGNYRVAHAWAFNTQPHAVTFTFDKLPTDGLLRGDGRTKYTRTRASLWFTGANLRNPSFDNDNGFSAPVPRPDFGNTSSNTNNKTYEFFAPCSELNCSDTTANVEDEPPTTDPTSAAFDDEVITSLTPVTSSLFTNKLIAPTCFLADNATGASTGTACTTVSASAGTYTLPPGGFAILSWVTSHTGGSNDFRPSGWAAQQDTVFPLLQGKSLNATFVSQNPPIPDNSVLWTKINNDTDVFRTLLFVPNDSSPNPACGNSSSEGCFWGRSWFTLRDAQFKPNGTTTAIQVSTGTGASSTTFSQTKMSIPTVLRSVTP